ncbi:MAG: diguanylate cyclase [Euzebyales bacterium]|nr:diguanylate cyclase [Euzebyales bacterium]
MEGVAPHRHGALQRVHLRDITADIARRLDFETVAQRIVDAVIQVTDFAVATLTLREGDRCRRLATAGLPDGRLGMVTAFERWAVLLEPDWLVGGFSYLVPPEAPALWADIPDIPASDDPDAWTAEHGLVTTLLDHTGEIIGFIAVDEPRSGRLPDSETIETLEVFAGQAQVAFANAHLYESARRQYQTMQQLFDVAKAMAATADFEQVAPRIFSALQDRLDASSMSVVRVHGPVADVRRVTAQRPDAIETTTVDVVGPLADLAELVLRHGSIRIDDLHDHPQLQSHVAPGTCSLLLAGYAEDGQLVVALTVSSPRPAAFTDDDAAFLRGLVDITAVAIRNADLYEEARFAAERDALTGLRNRRVFWTILQQALGKATTDRCMALVLIDVDDFKLVNDIHGHDTGDRALVHVASRLESGVRQTDMVFRIGGEEFVLIMPDTSAAEARMVLTRISDALKRSRLDLPQLTISAGVALAPIDAVTADGVFSAADAALYRAKRAGKDRVVLASA